MRDSIDTPHPRAGFTLIEILAVILIIGILVTVLITQFGGAQDAARVQTTRQRLSLLSAVIDSYEIDTGDYPPSSFRDDQGVPNDGTNVGVEALVVALWSDGREAGGQLEGEADKLINTDGDSSSGHLTDFEVRSLFELADAWGNPIAYFHRRDYAGEGQTYVTFDPDTGDELESVAKPFKNTATGRYYRARSYQLLSAGPDALFGTEDDVTDFDRKEEE